MTGSRFADLKVIDCASCIAGPVAAGAVDQAAL